MEINKSELDELLNTTGVVVVDFWASWCGPCRALARHYSRFAEDNPDLAIKKIDVEENEEVSQEFSIRSLPTIIYFKDGEEVLRLQGVKNTRMLQVKLDEVLKD